MSSYAARSAAAYGGGNPNEIRYSAGSHGGGVRGDSSVPSSVYQPSSVASTSTIGGGRHLSTPAGAGGGGSGRYNNNNNSPSYGGMPGATQRQSTGGNSFRSVYPQQQRGNDWTTPEAQSRLLNDCNRRVEEQSFYMRRAMDGDNLGVALDHAGQMLSELGPGSHTPSSNGNGSHHGGDGPGKGSSKLTPRNYYELYMKALEEMPHLEEFLLQQEDVSHGRLYDTVQYAPRVVPRLYLQICAGATLLRSEERGIMEVFRDLMDCVKCVQCPLRGLFLRNYLLQILRHRLPNNDAPLDQQDDATAQDDDDDTPARTPQVHPDVREAYTLLLQNFVEMNQLWVRIQHMPSSGSPRGRSGNAKPNKQERRRREKERNELRLLVGTNLMRLSEFEGLAPATYATEILPKVLEEIATCNDALAQAYLMDCVIQVFPDEYHMVTMRQFLEVCPKLKEKVNLRTILQALMERLTKYAVESNTNNHTDNAAEQNKVITIPLDTFAMLSECIESVAQTRVRQITTSSGNNTDVKPNHSEIIHLFTQLLTFSLKCYPEEISHISHCLEVCADTLNIFSATALMTEQSMGDLEKLLNIPLSEPGVNVLELRHFPTLLEFLPWDKRRNVAAGLVKSVLVTSAPRNWQLEQIHTLLTTVSPLWKEDPTVHENGGAGVSNSAEMESQAVLVSRLLHTFHHVDTDMQYKIMNLCKKHLMEGGTQRKLIALPSLLFATLPLVRRVYTLEYGEVVVMEEEEVDAPVEEAIVEKEETKEEETKEENKAAIEEDTKEEETAEKKEEVGNDDNEEKVDETLNKTNEDEAADEGEEADTKDVESEEQKAETTDDQVVKMAEEDETPAPENGDTVNAEEENKNEDQEEGFVSVAAPSMPPVPSMPPPPVPSVPPPPVPPPRPPVVFDKIVNCRKLFLFLQKLISSISTLDSELSFKLYLQLATVASSCAANSNSTNDSNSNTDFNAISYEFMVQAFSIYEDDITDCKAQYQAITTLCGTIRSSCKQFEKQDYEALVTKTAQYAAKLLKKPDQCKMVTLVSHLFYTGDNNDPTAYRNPQRVLECLQRSLKIADACSMASSTNVHLFIDILDNYVYYFEKENPLITEKFVSGLIALINEHLSSTSGDNIVEAKAYYRQILRYIMRKKDAGGRFANIIC